MKKRSALVVTAVVVLAGIAAASMMLSRDDDAATVALIDEYCLGCHNPVDLSGSLNLAGIPVDDVGSDAETWEQVVRKLKTGMMPPAGEPRPERAALDALTAELEARLDRAAQADPIVAPTPLRRLNRTEYANAIRDLLELDIDVSTLLPLDDSSEGFDNIASSLGVSPALVEAYVSAGMKISRWALGDPTAPQTLVTYSVPPDLAQDRHLDGLPLGTRGGLSVEHLFPLDAEYEIRIRRGFARGGRVDLLLDGEPVAADGPGPLRIPVTAGPHTLTATLVDTRRSDGIDDIYSAPASTAGIQGIEIDGPLNPTGIGETPSRQRVLICEPLTPAEEPACAAEIVTLLATRAFRRPLSPEELGPLLEFYEAGRRDGNFETGIQQALARVLVDPRFLYRVERDRPALAAGAVHPVDDYELASRLSFFLWSSIPDDELLSVAAGGRLGQPDELERQVRRMLADPKAAALVDNFASQWLFLRELESVTPDSDAFNENLKQAMVTETKLLFDTIVRQDLSLTTLLDADFTFVDERLAAHYGIDGVRGSHFRRIDVPADIPRRGLLGHGSILTITSVTNRTSPVIRGSWILETLLGSPAPVPPPNVETTLEGDDGALIDLSVRQRLEAHRENPNCASCHAIMDPIGFTLENFDLIGAWRDEDGGRPIDATATLVDGTAVDGPDALRAALLDRRDAFVTTAAEKMMTYALGRRIEHYDMPAIRAIVSAAAAEDYRFSAFVLGIVGSEAFRMRVNGANQ
ncbi:MAG: DUF1592 domain-containing protein [Gammaproteobacteria bacterium]|nr:DUF1592 domain-containing protein [Gammaproteobacteria bacterium]